MVFKVKNSSSKSIKIFSATSTCGCTSFNYPAYLNPNVISEIKVKFNSKGFSGNVEKNVVLVLDNETKFYKLSFFTNVINKKG